MKNILRSIKTNVPAYLACSIVSAVIVGTCLMILAYCIPLAPIRNNARESIPIYQNEADKWFWATGLGYTRIDNYTDSIMINEAAFLGTGSVIKDAMHNPHVEYNGVNSRSLFMIRAISADDLKDATVVNYPRYWHGYQIFLKPLLIFFNMQEVRIMNLLLQSFLLLLVLRGIENALGFKYVIAYFLAMIVISPISTALNMQNASIYYIMLISSLVLLHLKQERLSDTSWKVFLWTGIATAYFDFLTYPVVGIGVPLILCLCLIPDKGTIAMVKTALTDSVSWGLGYALMWSGKWGIAYALTGDNVIMDGVANVAKRTQSDYGNLTDISFPFVVKSNFAFLKNGVFLATAILIILTIAVLLLLKCVRFEYNSRIIPIIIVSLYPFLWYRIVANHSIIHAWMTYRNLVVTIFGILMSLCLLLNET